MTRVLLVDDEPLVLIGMQGMLNWAALGYEVVGTARNGAEALRAVQEKQPDIVVSDIRMPVMDGFALAEACHKDGSALPAFIMLTSYEEFALLNDYFTIQQYRYGGTITLDVSYIEDESLNHSCLIPRFTLQPLVENAIFHGIEPKGSAGEVTLRVERDTANGDVLIHLTDDGVGMTPEQAAKALQEPGPEEAAAKYRHVGMWNVHKRLQYSFGEAYGLSIESEPDIGTTVTIRLPGPDSQK